MKKFIFELLNPFKKPNLTKCPPENFNSHAYSRTTDKDVQKIVDHLTYNFQKEHGINLHNDPLAMQRLQEAVTKAITTLETSEKANINLPYISANARGPKHFNMCLTRDILQSLL